MTTYPAQIVFTEDDRGGYWHGRLLHPSACIDTQRHNQLVTWTPVFNIKEGSDGRFHITMQGGPDKGGRRYVSRKTLTDAQKAGIRWASRRFRVPS